MAVMHIPMPDYRKHAFLPERNGRTEERSLTISNSILERSLLIGNNNGGALWCWTALPLGARPILRKCGQTLRKCRRYPHPVTRGSCQEFLCTAPVQTTHAPQIRRAPLPPLVGTWVVWQPLLPTLTRSLELRRLLYWDDVRSGCKCDGSVLPARGGVSK